MPIDRSILGVRSGEYHRDWDDRDVLLYALAVGAGHEPDLAHRTFTAEQVEGRPLQVLPTFAVIPVLDTGGLRERYGDFDRSQLVHAEQTVSVHGTLPVAGSVVADSVITGLYDKGSGALIEVTTEAREAGGRTPLFTTRSQVFVRGEGGWGGDRGSASAPLVPDRTADVSITYQTTQDQALLYRLTGDRNPLHSDPAVARRGGFSRPILHGLCTLGFTGRALLATCCDHDPARFGTLSARFTKPVFPGDALTIEVWRTGDRTAAFRTSTPCGVVIDRGQFELSPTADSLAPRLGESALQS